MDLVARARAMMRGITPGDWAVGKENTSYVTASGPRTKGEESWYDGRVLVCESIGCEGRDADAEFIAGAPALVRELVAEAEKLARIRRVYAQWAEILLPLGSDNEQALHALGEILREEPVP